MTAPSCSDASAAYGEQLAGSAPYARAWVALEQNGPWGPRAFTGSRLDPDLGRAIETLAADHEVRPSLVRRPGRHADDAAADGGAAPRHVLVAHTDPRGSWLLEGSVGRPEELLWLDWAAVAAGDRDAVARSVPSLEPSSRPQLLVCTNGSRDVCCARKGRPVALAVAARRPDQVWEVTHTSGHRFAATAVLLPAGTLHGRLDEAAAAAVLEAAEHGETVLSSSRGRSTWPAPAQVAELAVRERIGETALDAVWVDEHREDAAHAWTTTLAHRDGRRWTVTTRSDETGTQRAESCGKEPLPLRRWTTTVHPSPVVR